MKEERVSSFIQSYSKSQLEYNNTQPPVDSKPQTLWTWQLSLFHIYIVILLQVKDNFSQFPIFMSWLLQVDRRQKNRMAACILHALLFLTESRDYRTHCLVYVSPDEQPIKLILCKRTLSQLSFFIIQQNSLHHLLIPFSLRDVSYDIPQFNCFIPF